ncbi:MAG: hypothetical protein ACE5EK_06025, partial [Nitrospinales bacterium]
MYREHLEKIFTFVTSDDYSEEARQAQSKYREVAGDIFEDDNSYETRMTMFLEWYLFDRLMQGGKFTPLDNYIEKNKDQWSPEIRQIHEMFRENIKGIFVIKKIKRGSVVAKNLFDNISYLVREDESEIIFRKNDIFEGRIIPFDGNNRFTGNFCFHPQEALKFIKTEITKINKTLVNLKSELKDLNSENEKIVRETKKLIAKSNKLTEKMNKSRSLAKKSALEEKITELDRKTLDLLAKNSELESTILDIKTIKINKEIP